MDSGSTSLNPQEDTPEEEPAAEGALGRRELWLAENREAIEAYNEHVSRHGVFSDGLRGF
jgi:antitoxin CcdA